eukprot:jgi/Chrzof1/10208/Cz04g32220.t1
MLHDIQLCGSLKVDGVVFGALTADGQVDVRTTAELVATAKQLGLDVTFHRAFDMCCDLRVALEALIRLGVPRVLTSGGCATASEGCSVLQQLVAQSAGRIGILGAGGIRANNVAHIIQQTGVTEIHSSAKRLVQSCMLFRPSAPQLTSLCSATAASDWEWGIADEGAVQDIVSIVSSKQVSTC